MRVALADDSALFRSGLATLLRSAGVEVVLETGSGDELLARLRPEEDLDVAVLDIRMPPTYTDEGLGTALEVRARSLAAGVLVLSTYAETSYAARLLSRGARGIGYLQKDRVDDVATLLDALSRLSRGESVIDPDIVHRLVQRRGRLDELERLQARERQVLEQMAQGRSNAGIAAELHLSVKTVERHIASVFDALGLPCAGEDNRRVLAVLSWLRAVND